MPVPHSDQWHAVWAVDAANGHEEAYGTKAEVLAWSTARCDRVLVWSEEAQDVVAL